MKVADSADEEHRLEALRRYEVLDTLPERALDELTELASQICQVPVALISLIDKDRQWFKSKVGQEDSETSREISFCAHALHLSDLLIVPDATQDERFAKNPVVTEDPFIRFYAGAPLKTPDGFTLGTLCVVDYEPRQLSPLQEQTLRVLSNQVMAHLELRKRARQLQESEERNRAVIESALDAIVTIDHEDRITEFNPAAEKMFGRNRESLMGENMAELLIPAEFREAHRRGLRRFLETGETRVLNRRREFQALRADNTHFNVELTVTRLGQGTPPSFTAFLRDITERRRLEQQFLRAQRMESIGTLAGGIAHDLNNVFGPIILSIDLLKLQQNKEETQEVLDIIESNAHRGADMVRQVLSFSRGLDGQRLEVQLKYIIEDVEKVAQETFPRNIKIEKEVAQDLSFVAGDPTQLYQALLNLCLNARDAMPQGGRIVISASNVVLDAQYVSSNPEAEAGPYLLLEVSDNGCGIEPHLFDRIFEPFVTTKEFGQGSGLGLSSTLAIVKSHSGFIRVQSEATQGSTFQIFLPALQQGKQEESREPAVEMPRGNGELVLVVDDEISVRQITQQTLEAFGYRVLLACDGADALATYTLRSADIKVVLTDIMMPVMDGAATIKVLRKLNPNLPIIAASGFNPLKSGGNGDQLGVDYYLTKPYTAETLLKALKLILEEPQSVTQ